MGRGAGPTPRVPRDGGASPLSVLGSVVALFEFRGTRELITCANAALPVRGHLVPSPGVPGSRPAPRTKIVGAPPSWTGRLVVEPGPRTRAPEAPSTHHCPSTSSLGPLKAPRPPSTSSCRREQRTHSSARAVRASGPPSARTDPSPAAALQREPMSTRRPPRHSTRAPTVVAPALQREPLCHAMPTAALEAGANNRGPGGRIDCQGRRRRGPIGRAQAAQPRRR